MKKTLFALSLTASAFLTGCGGGGGDSNPGWDWDGFLVSGSTQWRCRDIGNGQFAPDHACTGLPKTDQRWPTVGVVPVPGGGWTKGVEISKVCAGPMEDYKIKMQSVQSIHALDYKSIGVNTPMPIVDGVITKSYIDIGDALWEAAPYVATTKPRGLSVNGTVYFSWDLPYPNTQPPAPLHNTDYWREANTGTIAIMWKKSDFHWVVWVIRDGKCGSFNMENGNYKGLTVL